MRWKQTEPGTYRRYWANWSGVVYKTNRAFVWIVGDEVRARAYGTVPEASDQKASLEAAKTAAEAAVARLIPGTTPKAMG